MIHATGILGFAHAYYVLDLRHAEAWGCDGTHIHEGRYSVRFEQNGELVNEGDQTAIFTRVEA